MNMLESNKWKEEIENEHKQIRFTRGSEGHKINVGK